MKTLVLILLATTAAHATTKDLFKDVTFTQPKCYGHEYSKKELAAKPQQTVTQMKAKLLKYDSDPSVDSSGLQIELRLKDGAYHADMSCFDNEGKTLCASTAMAAALRSANSTQKR